MEENHHQNGPRVPKIGVSSESLGVLLNFPEIQVEKRLLRNLATVHVGLHTKVVVVVVQH